MNIIRNLPIRAKMTLLVLVPLLLSIGFIANDLRGNLQTLQTLKLAEEVSEVSIQGAQLVHELQKERGISATLIASKGKMFSSALPGQIQQSDLVAEKLRAVIHKDMADLRTIGLGGRLDKTLELLDALPEMRAKVQSGKVKTKQIMAFYDELNTELFGLTAQLSSLANNATIARQASAYVYLLQYKESAGKERAILGEVFIRDRFNAALKKQFSQNQVAQTFYLDTFKAFASEANIAMFDATMDNPATAKVTEFTELTTYQSRTFKVKPTDWFSAASARIDLLKEVENKLEDQLDSVIRGAKQQQLNTIGVMLAIAAVALLITLWLSFYLVRNIVSQIKLLSVAVNRISEHSDLTHNFQPTSEDELGKLSHEFNTMVEHLRELTGSVNNAGGQIGHAVKDMQGISQEVVDQVADGMDQTNHIAASLQQVSSSVNEVSANCSQAAAESEQAVVTANSGQQSVVSANQAMENLRGHINSAMDVINQVAEDSTQIGSILDVIKGIAEQTNLLALNAAIEAARAGEQGRGFAVVADEVRSLAYKTQESTEQIEQMIDQLQNRSRSAVSSMEESHSHTTRTAETVGSIQEQLDQIIQQISIVNDMNLQNATATEQQSAAVGEITNNIGQIQQKYHQTNDSVGELGKTTESMQGLSDKLIAEVSRFKI